MSAQRRYRFGPLEARGVVGPLRVGQVLVVAVAAALALGALYALRSWAGMVLALVLLGAAGALIYLPLGGRTAEEWAPIALRWALRSGQQRRGYRSSSPGAGASAGPDGVAFEPSLPPELAGLAMLEAPYKQDTVGVICDRAAGTYTAAIAVKAGAFSLLDGAEQERKLGAWGSVLDSLAADECPISRVQWVERTLPAQGDEMAAYFQRERDRAVPLDSNLISSYIELVESAAPATREHEILIAIQIEERRAARQIRHAGGGIEGACAVLMREAERLAEQLSLAELTVYGLLRPRRYAAAIRDAFDPYGRASRSRAGIRDAGREGTDPALMGPLAAEAEWGEYRSDSARHATHWISAWPRTDVGPAFLTPLLMQTTALRTVAVCIEPVPYSTAIRRAEAARTAEVAEEMARERQGFLTSARIRRRQQATARQEEELADGHALVRFAGYVAASAPREPGALEHTVSEVRQAATLAGLELQPLYGEQAEGFTFTLPLGWGLR